VNFDKEIALSSNNVCCISDIHVGVHQNSIVWHETALKWAEWLKKDLQDKKIKDIFILGDLFHYRDEIAVNTIHIVNQILKLWEDFNIVMIVGNHDSYYKDRTDVNSLCLLNGWKNIKIISDIHHCTILGKTASFVPWGADITKLQKTDVMFGHLEIESFKMHSYKLCDRGVKTSDLLAKADLIMSGHFHLRDERKYDNKTIIYIGNPFEMDFGDINDTKGYYILNFSDLSYKFYENKLSPKHRKLTLTELTTLSATDIKNNIINNNIVKLLIDKNVQSDDIDLLIQKLSTHQPFNLSVDYSLYNNNVTVNEDQACDISGVDMSKAIEEFIEVLDIEKKSEISKYCVELYKKAQNK
jgi:DNA repair exonuclease SbcCD nuclease subunit